MAAKSGSLKKLVKKSKEIEVTILEKSKEIDQKGLK